MSEIHLLDQWSISTDTAFRIPQLMRELRTNLVWSKITHLKDNPFIFIRRILTGNADEAELAALAKVSNSRSVFPHDYNGPPILFEFTFSSRLQKLFDHHQTESPLNLDEFRTGIEKLLDAITDHPREWRSVLLALSRNHQLELKLAERLMSFDRDAYESSPLRWLSELYWLYSRCSHFGFAAEELSKVHFHRKGEYSTGCSNVLAYLLRTRNSPEATLPPIEGLFRIDISQKLATPALKLNSPKEQSAGRFYLLGLGQNEQALNIFPKFFAALYEVFNELVERKAFHQVFVPVYERDIFARSDLMAEDLTLEVAGTFLGWLCYDFGDDPPKGIFADEIQPDPNKWCFGGEPSPVSDAFCNDLIHLRFLLNYFSEQYLEGEKEWALQQPMGQASTLGAFVAENVHHFGGWIGDTCNSERPPWLTGVFAFNPTNDDPTGVDELWIDITTKPAWESPLQERPVILKMRKRSDTALPSCKRALHDYGVCVSKSVRNFFDRAKLLEIKQEIGRSILADEFAHEIKSAAWALSKGWLATPTAKALLEKNSHVILPNGKTLGELLESASIALVPDLFNHVKKVLLLQTASKVDQLDGSIRSESSIMELVRVALDLSVSDQVCRITTGLDLSSKEDLGLALEAPEKVRKRDKDFNLIEPAGTTIRFSPMKFDAMSLDFVRLFAALFANWRRHSPDSAGLTCNVTLDRNSMVLVLKNKPKEETSTPSQGLKIIEKLILKLKGKYEYRLANEAFTQTIIFPRGSFDVEMKGE